MRETLTRVREQLSEQHQAIRRSHELGLAPVQVCAKLTAAADSAIQSLWNDTLADFSDSQANDLRSGCVLVAHGGYGRRQLAPHSDLDVMVLHEESVRPLAMKLAQRFTRDVFDIGLDLGHSLRTPSEAMQMARQDVKVATSLIESRPLIGSPPLFESFFGPFSDSIKRRKATESVRYIAARRLERHKYGETVYLLEPNIKRSRGALRDLHLLRWLWFLQTGLSDLDRLRSAGVISKFDHHRLCSSRDFMLRVRNDLHFSSAKPTDSLTRHEQLAIAERLGYQGVRGLRPVEEFMGEYFRHASHVWFLSSRLCDLTTPRPTVERVLDPMLSRSVERDYRIGLREVSATPDGLEKLRRSVDEAFRAAELARDYDRRLDQSTWYAIYRAAPNYSADLDSETSEHFLSLLDNPNELGPLLRRLHELAVLEKAVPAIGEARFLLQFNQYHKYTVDEHCLRTVEEATRFAERRDLLGKTYRQIKNKRLLHLALLLHDLGKGREEDHSVVGEAIAMRTGARLRLKEEDTARLALLVRRHLSMSLLAFRRDTSDPEVIEQFSSWIGSVENLAMLFVLTCADMAAVGPGVLNDWKVGVLADLYRSTRERLLSSTGSFAKRRGALRTSVWQLLKPDERDDSWFKQQFASLPESFLTSRSPAALVTALRRIRKITGCSEADAWGSYQQDGATLEMVATAGQGVGKGVFSKMAGALSAKGLSILAAETAVLEDEALLLRFVVEDPRASDSMNAAEANARVKSVAASMIASFASDEPPRFPSVWGADRKAEQAALTAQPNEVRIDTQLSDRCAIVEVFTIDRTGLLYELARALHDMELVIHFARIATSLDQVVDVFYVAERDGSKPTDPDRLEGVSQRLMGVIEG